MDLPQPPQDQELRNIIDKLAQFVARNGLEFENMTKNKQKDNPKFSFLFGGEHFNYYQYKVTTEQAILKQKAKVPMTAAGPGTPPHMLGSMGHPGPPTQPPGPPPGPPGMQPWMPPMGGAMTVPPAGPPPNVAAPPPSVNVDAILAQQQRLQEQIHQSEQNLVAQQQVMTQQQHTQAEEALRVAQQDKARRMADEAGVDPSELDALLQPIIESCTKDSISQGKGWILARAGLSPRVCPVIALLLLNKVCEPNAQFSQKLHVIYLVNDVLHHCVRKNADELKKALEGVVVPMYCNASININEEQRAKLNKLLNLWESKNCYFDSSIVDKLKNPQQSWAEYRAALIAEHAAVVTPISNNTQATYEAFRVQHQAFVNHASQQIQVLENQKLQAEQQAAAAAAVAAAAAAQAAAAAAMTQGPPPGVAPEFYASMQQQPPPQGQPPPAGMLGLPPPRDLQFSQPPPGYVPMNVPPPGLPDLSKPPPGFPPQPAVPVEPKPDELMPSVAYYELPAGLMVSLIRLEDTAYKPLDPDAIRLPPPAPPSERLIAAIEAFYAPPSHERPRDSEGWEKLALYEYFRAKNNARKKRDEDIKEGKRQKSRSPSPVVRPRSRSKSPPRRRYRSSSRSLSPKPEPQIQPHGRDPRPVRPAGPPPPSRPRQEPSPPVSRRSPPPPPERGDRSPTPPSFLGSAYGGPKPDGTIDESNKGHQMLKRMGWGGAGLGAKEQGIEQPISGGEVRDRQDQFKGVGINLNDPYENFRKSKAASFISRMKARAEET